nr:Chain O, MALATE DEHYDROGENASE [synthetic construct]1HR9_P Chain P, MALATE DEHYDROGENASE [synthetic construct]1HR9_Q Chain Q, MALATE DEHYDROGENASE [synthetic construct]1HR9_R Chain R, MALATE DEHYDROGENASE [synthetic construct]
LSRVAKRA